MLDDLKIVELASVLAGPTVGMFFAELGAEVIKVEHPVQGDVTRSWKLSSEDPSSPVSAYYAAANFGKQSIRLNLKDTADYRQLIALIEQADVLILNFKSGDAEKFNLTYETLKAKNPRLIYADLRGFASQPERVAYDVVLQAETGYMSMNGERDHPPLKMPLAFMDLLAAHQMKQGILLALYQRERSGKGAHVGLSLEEAALANLANQASNWLMAGHVPQRIGSLHPNIAPYGEQFELKDGKILVLAIGADHQFRKLCELLGDPDLADKDVYATNRRRVINRTALQKELRKLLSKWNSTELMTMIHQNNIPAGIVKTLDEVFETKVATEMVLNQTTEGHTTKAVATIAFKIEN